MRLLTILLLMAVACTNNKQAPLERTAQTAIVDLVPGQKLVLPVDQVTTNSTRCMFSYVDQDGSALLGYLNENKNEIQFYDLNKQALTYRIPLAIEGPDGVGTVLGFNVRNLDSIFVFPLVTRAYLVNRSGKVMQTINYNQTSKGQRLGPGYVLSENLNTAEWHNGKLFMHTSLLGNYNHISQDQLAETYIEIAIDTTRKTVEHVPVTFPDDYHNDGYKDLIACRIMNQGKLIYSFVGDHSIHVIAADGKQKKKYSAKSQYFDNISPFEDTDGDDVDSYLRYAIETPYYGSILYDRFRNVYYRYAYPGTEVKKGDNLMQKARYKSAASIIVLDSNFNKIGETMLPKDTYMLTNSFVGEKGLYISNNHPSNPANEEDKLIFTLFTLNSDAK